eukprot:Nk52_evm12s2630 gene=Nk52_evmTU12s2630
MGTCLISKLGINRHGFTSLAAFLVMSLLINSGAVLVEAGIEDNNELHQLIYKYYDTGYACRRYLNVDGQVGCSSKRFGEPCVVYQIATTADLQSWKQNNNDDPYGIVLADSLFTKDNVDFFYNSGKVSALIVYPDSSTKTGVTSYSGDSPGEPCPNCKYGLYRDESATLSKHKWNSYATEMFYTNYEKFSMTFVNNTETLSALSNCSNINKDKEHYPLCSMQVDTFMTAAGNAETCLRRGRCEPVGGYNVFGSVRPIKAKEKVVVAMAQVDSLAMFPELSFGAENDVSGLVVLLAAARALKPVDKKFWENNLLFLVPTGESFGYVGSSAFAYDLKNMEFPFDPNNLINLTNIDSIMEVSQVGLAAGGSYNESKLSIQSDMGVKANSKTDTLIDLILGVANADNETNALMQNWTSVFGMPPASSQSFLLEDREIPAVVITDYKDEFLNGWYQSRRDTSPFNNLMKPDAIARMCKLVTVYARSLYKRASGIAYIPTVESFINANCTEVTYLLDCLTVNQDCRIRNNLWSGDMESVRPFYFTGVVPRGNTFGPLFAYYWLAYSLASSINKTVTESECAPPFAPDFSTSLVYTNNSCVNTSVFLTEIRSPGFGKDGDDYWIRMSNYSTWTVSNYEYFETRLFLVNSEALVYVNMGLGIIMIVFGSISVWIGRFLIKRTLRIR